MKNKFYSFNPLNKDLFDPSQPIDYNETRAMFRKALAYYYRTEVFSFIVFALLILALLALGFEPESSSGRIEDTPVSFMIVGFSLGLSLLALIFRMHAVDKLVDWFNEKKL